MFVHVSCGVNLEEEGYGKSVLCKICKNNADQIKHRDEAKEGLKKQAKKMLTNSDTKFPSVSEGATVRIQVPDVDRAKTDARSILAVVLGITEDGFYKLGTKTGILKQFYARSQFSVCKEIFLTEDDVPTVEVSLRQTAIKQSLGTGQGLKKCDCKSKCATNKCACRKNQLLCNSKCHKSLNCTNK